MQVRQEHRDRLGKYAEYEAGESTIALGATPFAGSARGYGQTSLNDAFYDSLEYEDFQKTLKRTAAKYGITINDHQRAVDIADDGSGDVSAAPASALSVTGQPQRVRAMMIELNSRFNQSEILEVRKGYGPGQVHTYSLPEDVDPNEVAADLLDAEEENARITSDGRLVIAHEGDAVVNARLAQLYGQPSVQAATVTNYRTKVDSVPRSNAGPGYGRGDVPGAGGDFGGDAAAGEVMRKAAKQLHDVDLDIKSVRGNGYEIHPNDDYGDQAGALAQLATEADKYDYSLITTTGESSAQEFAPEDLEAAGFTSGGNDGFGHNQWVREPAGSTPATPAPLKPRTKKERVEAFSKSWATDMGTSNELTAANWGYSPQSAEYAAGIGALQVLQESFSKQVVEQGLDDRSNLPALNALSRTHMHVPTTTTLPEILKEPGTAHLPSELIAGEAQRRAGVRTVAAAQAAEFKAAQAVHTIFNTGGSEDLPAPVAGAVRAAGDVAQDPQRAIELVATYEQAREAGNVHEATKAGNALGGAVVGLRAIGYTDQQIVNDFKVPGRVVQMVSAKAAAIDFSRLNPAAPQDDYALASSPPKEAL
ncbi:hypothetical protein GCM10025777_39110 [Membranihabitans marinus]|uniref:Uncharacterized protein n=2 Tax=Nesterenkonia rhizosphaerae TaxID=1348272 RepID=A0ABP9G0G1_9MICC